MSTHNICFYGELTKIILQLSWNTLLICSSEFFGKPHPYPQMRYFPSLHRHSQWSFIIAKYLPPFQGCRLYIYGDASWHSNIPRDERCLWSVRSNIQGKVTLYILLNPFMPGIPFLGPWQAVQSQIRCLIRGYTVWVKWFHKLDPSGNKRKSDTQ